MSLEKRSFLSFCHTCYVSLTVRMAPLCDRKIRAVLSITLGHSVEQKQNKVFHISCTFLQPLKRAPSLLIYYNWI